MSKKYKGKLCVYCAQRQSETGDHIFAREFFLAEDRGNLPKAPACKKCNCAKSTLEHYLVSVMPFGASHSQASTNLTTNVPRRLEKNQKLRTELNLGVQRAWLRDDGSIYVPTTSVSFDGEKLEKLLKYTVRGLAWYHWKEYISKEWAVRVMFLPDILSSDLQGRMHSLGSERIISRDLGRGTVQYEAAQVGRPTKLIFLVVALYGGVMLAAGSHSDPTLPNETSRHWWVIAGEPEFAAQVETLGRRTR